MKKPVVEENGKIEVVNLKRFLQATRDSGYRNFESSIAEIIDNSLQAEARQIDISLHKSESNPSDVYVAILDNGRGMTFHELMIALQFGGSNRFNDRSGLGRFGMGLPNSSLSQARRVDVYSWQNRRAIWHTYLDLDELIQSEELLVPRPTRAKLPENYADCPHQSGTLVIWRKLDRVKMGAWGVLTKRMEHRIGQKFRHFLWSGQRITCNGDEVTAFDPLYLSVKARTPFQSAQFGDVLKYKFALADRSNTRGHSVVEVRFSELPVSELAGLSNQEKRSLGIVNGAGVSIVRGGREIDYGWFFLDKRRENYDDWWRCEICFLPDLDEIFGVTHTKQGIRPTDELQGILAKELSPIARTLNRRVQNAHMAVAAQRANHAAADHAANRDVFLRPIVICQDLPVSGKGALHGQQATSLLPLDVKDGKQKYRLVAGEVESGVFYKVEINGSEVMVTLNRLHEFYLRIYQVLLDGDESAVFYLRKQMELVLLALGRSHLLNWSETEENTINRFIEEWSRAITIFCGTVTLKK